MSESLQCRTCLNPVQRSAPPLGQEHLKLVAPAVSRCAIEAGLGVGCVPDFVAQDALAAGRVVRLLPEWAFDTNYQGMAYLLFAGSRYTAPKVRVFIDHLVTALAPGLQAA